MATNKEILLKFINEQSQKVQSDISQQGYKRDSPYVDRPKNIIQGQPGQPTSITMQGVDKTLMGIDEHGNKQIMHPGEQYEFPGSQVTETPVAKYGGLLNKTIKCSNCGWSWKAADGGNDVNTCHKCGEEVIVKAEAGGDTYKFGPIPITNGDFYDIDLTKQQYGGVNFIDVSKNEPIIIPSQGSYPLSYKDRGPVNAAGIPSDENGILFTSAKKVSRVDEQGNPLTRNQIAENQANWNAQKQAYGPAQQDFNIWKNNEENTNRGFYNTNDYQNFISKLNEGPDVGIEGLCDPTFSHTKCGISKQKAKESKADWSKKQNGGEHSDELDWIKKYVSSPKYKERITNAGYDNPDRQINKRLQNLENVNITENSNVQGSQFNPNRNTIETNYPADLEYYNIHKNLYPTKPELSSVIAHELAHAETYRPNSATSLLNKRDREQLKNRLVPDADEDLQVYIDNYLRQDKSHHNIIPEENKADINAYRYDIRNQYDAGTQDFTKENLDKSPSSFAKERLLKNYSPDDLIWLMNNIAQNSTDGQIPTAQYGGGKFLPKKFATDQKVLHPSWQNKSAVKEAQSDDRRRMYNTKAYQDQVIANKIAQDKATVQDRKDRINASVIANKKGNLFTDNDWRQQLADRTQATGDKFRIFPEDPNSFIDDYINPGVFIGNMASGLGSAPLRAQEEDSYMPYVTSVAEPMVMGAVGEIVAPYINKVVAPYVNKAGKIVSELPGPKTFVASKMLNNSKINTKLTKNLYNNRILEEELVGPNTEFRGFSNKEVPEGKLIEMDGAHYKNINGRMYWVESSDKGINLVDNTYDFMPRPDELYPSKYKLKFQKKYNVSDEQPNLIGRHDISLFDQTHTYPDDWIIHNDKGQLSGNNTWWLKSRPYKAFEQRSLLNDQPLGRHLFAKQSALESSIGRPLDQHRELIGDVIKEGSVPRGGITITPTTESSLPNIEGLKSFTYNPVTQSTERGIFMNPQISNSSIKNVTTDFANPLKDVITTFKNRNKKLLTVGAENLDKELLSKIKQLESPEGFNRLVNQEADMLKRDFPNVIDLENKAINNAQTRISELYQTALKGNFNANYLEAKKLNPNLTPQEFGIPTNNAFFRQGTGSSNFSDNVINLSKEPSMKNDIFSKTLYSAEMPGEIAIGREYAEGIPVYDHEINHALQNSRNTELDDLLKKYFNNSKNLATSFSEKTNKAYNYFRKNKQGMPAREPSSFLAETRRAMLERGLIKNIYEPITPKKVFDAMKHFKIEPYTNPYNDQSYHRIFDFANDSPQTLKFLSNAFNKLPGILPIGLATGATAVGLQKEKFGGNTLSKFTSRKEMGGLFYKNENGTLPHNQSVKKYLAPEQTLINFMTKMQKENGGAVPFGEYYKANIINSRNKS